MKYTVSLLSFVLVFSFLSLGCKKTDDGDGTKPEIVVLGANPMFWALNYPYTDLGAKAYDVSSTGDTTDLTLLIVVDSKVDVTQVGEYQVTYNVKDASGLAADEKRRLVKVVIGK